MGDFIIGIDTGGTFTDCVVVDPEGRITTAKAQSTPQDFSQGVLDSLALAAERLGLDAEGLLRRTARLALGTTVGTNALLQCRGARVGLITTRGHRDVIHIMRGARGVPGLASEKVLHFPESNKPDPPIVPKTLIAEVSERVDCKGVVVVGLNETEAEAAIRRLVARGVEAIAICFLWSFKHPEHERRVKAMTERIAPDVFVCCSADLVPRWGEYERTAATVINAYLGPVTGAYMDRVGRRVRAAGLRTPVQVMQCGGGVVPSAQAAARAFLTLDSGPVAGVLASQYLGNVLGQKNVIATDMGGTSFDVGLVSDGVPVASYQSVVNQYEYFVPRIEVRSIGSGGGSIIWLEETSGSLRVGPVSAGAVPGPVSYGRGGIEPTVTDAALVLGYLDPDYFLGGRLRLDRDAAARSLEALARRLGLGVVEAASGAARVVEHQMADLIRKVTVQKGYDPRDFVVFAYGGAGPVHAGVYARELGAQGVVVPLTDVCSLWSALGAASADLLHIHEAVDIMASPFDPARALHRFTELEAAGRAQLAEEATDPTAARITRSADMRYRGQINEVEVPVAPGPLDPPALEQLVADFHRRYETLYGQGAGFREARVEIVTYRVRTAAPSTKPAIRPLAEKGPTPPAPARAGTRAVYWAELGDFEPTPIFWGERLEAGNVVAGPAIIQVPDTTIVVHPWQTARLDLYGNVLIDLDSSGRVAPGGGQ
jgi:N-methylhydantoinase A